MIKSLLVFDCNRIFSWKLIVSLVSTLSHTIFYTLESMVTTRGTGSIMDFMDLNS